MAGWFRVKVLGVRQAIYKFLRVGVTAEAGLRVIQARAAKRIEGRARALVPVAEGHLQAGIQAQYIGGTSWAVTASSRAGGADKEYAAFVEYGTYKMAARPFLRPATEGESAAVTRDLAVLAARLEAL